MYKIIIISVIIIFLFLGAIFYPIVFPNFLNIDFDNYDLTIKLFSNISVILASIFGIIIAIFLVSFQMFKKNYVSYSIKDFFKDANIVLLFISYLSAILISYISLTFIRQNYYSNKIVNLYYLSFFLFLMCISFLYFFIKSILTSNYSNNKTEELISNLKYNNILDYSKKYSSDLLLGKDYFNKDKNPHLFLEEMFTNAVKRKDGLAIITFYRKLRIKIFDLLEKSKNPEETERIFKFFKGIHVNTAQVAIKEYEKSILLTVLNSLFPIYLYCIDKNIMGESIKELDHTLREILLLIIESNNVLPIRFTVYLYGIKDNIISFSKKQENDSVDNPAKNQMQMLFDITNRAIETRTETFAKEGLNKIIDVIYEAIEETNIPKSRRKNIVEQCYEIYKYLIFKMFSRGLYDIDILIYSFHSEKIFNIIKKNIDFSNQILMLYCEILLELANKNILDEFSIENLGLFGERIILNQSDIINSNEFILYIFDVMNRLRRIIEGSSESLVLAKYGILSTQIEHLKKLIDKNKKEFTQIEKEVSSIYGSFMNFKPLFVKYKPLDWPDFKVPR